MVCAMPNTSPSITEPTTLSLFQKVRTSFGLLHCLWCHLEKNKR